MGPKQCPPFCQWARACYPSLRKARKECNKPAPYALAVPLGWPWCAESSALVLNWPPCLAGAAVGRLLPVLAGASPAARMNTSRDSQSGRKVLMKPATSAQIIESAIQLHPEMRVSMRSRHRGAPDMRAGRCWSWNAHNILNHLLLIPQLGSSQPCTFLNFRGDAVFSCMQSALFWQPTSFGIGMPRRPRTHEHLTAGYQPKRVQTHAAIAVSLVLT